MQLLIIDGDFRLALQMLQLLGQFLTNVVDTQQIFTRVFQACFGFSAALAVFRHAGGFFEKYPQLFRLGLDDARDHALFDNGVSARAQAGAEENIGNIAAAHHHVVDVIGGIAFALKYALDGNFTIRRPLPRRFAQAVVEQQFHAGAVDRFAVAGAIKQNVLHRRTAQMLGRGFTQHPAHGVDDVRLAAAVGAYDAHQLTGYRNLRGIDK